MSVAIFSANDGVDGANELFVTNGLAAGTGLLKDVYPGAAGSSPGEFTLFNGQAYFVALDNTTGSSHVWKTDGTAAGTVQVTVGSNGSEPSNLIVAGGALFFSATQFVNGVFSTALFKSDGTTAGTVSLHTVGIPSAFTAAGNLLFFAASDSTNGNQLWVSDGTVAGTHITKIISPGISGAEPNELVAAGSKVFFTTAAQSGFWVSDGTSVGTQELETFEPFDMVSIGTKIFFYAFDTAHGSQPGVWTSDGTQAGTFSLTGAKVDSVNYLTSYKGLLYFYAFDTASSSNCLFKSDGTVAGTSLVAHVTMQQAPINVGGTLFFFGSDPQSGSLTLYKSDGSTAGTVLVTVLAGVSSEQQLTAVGSNLFFTAADFAHGNELWVSDGTSAGTHVIDVNPGTASSSPTNLTTFNGKLLFTASTSATGNEVYISDGTIAGTGLVKDIFPGTNSSNSTGFTLLPNGQPTGGQATATIASQPASISGTQAKLTGTYTDSNGTPTIKVFNGTTLLGTATINTSTLTWSFILSFSTAQTYSGLQISLADTTGGSATASASFTLQTGLTGQPYVTIESDVNGQGSLVSREYFRSDGSLFATEIDNSDGSFSYLYTAITGQSYTSFESDYDAGGVLLDERFGGVSGQAYTSEEVDYDASQIVVDDIFFGYTNSTYTTFEQFFDIGGNLTADEYFNGNTFVEEITFNSDGSLGYIYSTGDSQAYAFYEYDFSGNNFIGVSYYFTDISNSSYTSYEESLTPNGNLTRLVFSGISTQAYSSYEFDYVGGVYSGAKFEFTLLASGAAYSSYETDYNFASVYQGVKFFFTDFAGQLDTNVEEDFDASGRLELVLLTGITGESYSSLEEDFSAGIYTGYKAFYTGITGQAYTGEEVDASATNQLTKVVYLGLSGTPFSSVEEDYSAGALTAVIYGFTNVANAAYYAYQVTDNAAGAALREVVDNNDGSHQIVGFGAASQTFTSIANDTFTGGGANETFMFSSVYGHDTITDFVSHLTGTGHDTISLSTSEFANFAAVLSDAQNAGGNVLISAQNGDTLTLSGLSTSVLAGLTGDFTFHA